MLPTIISQGNQLALNEAIARLALHDAVNGVLLMGSTGQNALSPASDYDLEVDIRLLFTVNLLFCDYFHIRGMPWQGSKAAMRWLEHHDPDYLTLFTQAKCISEKI